MMMMKKTMNVSSTMKTMIGNRVKFSSTLASADLTFNVSQATEASYSTLLTNIRNLVKNPNLHYGHTNLPVMYAPTKPPRFITIDLKSNFQNVITVALSRNDLYMVGYLNKPCNTYQSHFFKDALPYTSSLFPVATGSNRVGILYDSSYAQMEKNAKIQRSKLGLGPMPLNKLINDVYGKKVIVSSSEARFLLTAIQIISEAARFKYIEDMVLENFASFYSPDFKAIEYEKSWEKTSKSVKNSTDGVLHPSLYLVDKWGKQWVVTKVAEVAGDVGLFKNVENSTGLLLGEEENPEHRSPLREEDSNLKPVVHGI